MTAIYKISNTINDKFYIGSAVSYTNRVRVHKCHLLKNTHSNPILQSHVNKYGFESLIFSTIENCDRVNMIEREQYYIDTLNPSININRIAQSPKGLKRTPEQIQRMIDGRMKKSGYPKGRTLSEEARKKISIAHKGKVISEQQKERQRLLMKGRPVSDETRQKISLANKGRPVSDEHRLKLSKALQGNSNGKKNRS